jgi:hypothetical protein
MIYGMTMIDFSDFKRIMSQSVPKNQAMLRCV